ncbi:NADP-dependent malic enzyme [Porticoccus litoralis]|jgi:malate dehydrogenase (oxaloacetate-decarboxylating)(NADP+)|uniref:NADP-dependent malic enzyme n=1 Tax=Porticoccus litoralis TaxID=434086 RepID=A0AAW8AYP8_9GAMM|nr:NADP-dependent malic enzyme [Porticoccus litoralis]MDP1519573.1 NADP-dependent malic enzyme [Porticoccus litoralis]
MADSFKESALHYHTHPVPGKLEIRPTKPLANKRDLSQAYSPGVAYACGAIVKNPTEVANVTARGNLVAVISNGTAVLGLGDIGPLAAKPVMEGKAVLFKKFANIDVFDIEIDETDVDKLVDTIASLEPTFGGINLEDIKAPECFLVERKLRERMNIPVFHDDQHGTAIVSAAAVYNGLRIVDKKIEDIKLVVTGAGAASIACVDLLVSMGLKKANVRMIDRNGVIYKGREAGMNPWKESYAVETEDRTLDDAIVDADLFLGLSGPGILKDHMVKKMADKPLILAMSNPTPEIMPEVAKAARPDAILATGRSDYPNQVNNVLCFPFIFRGALDCGATVINDAMKQACVKAIADLVHREASEAVAEAYAGEVLKFGPEYLIPKPFDPRLIEEVPVAVVKAAMESGVATRPIEDLEAYRQKLHSYVSRSRLFMQPMIEQARRNPSRIAYAEGENDDVLRAMQGVVDEKVAHPILIGRPAVINRKIAEMGLRIQPGIDIEIINPEEGDHHENYWQFYHQHVGRSGVSVEAAQNAIHTNNTVLAAIMVALGDADGLICGKVGRFDNHLRDIQSILPQSDTTQMSSVCVLLMEDGPLFLADPFVNVDPTEEQVVATALNTIGFVKSFGIEPKVALLSHSNFGTYDDPSAHKMKRAAEQLRNQFPDLQIEGEMHAMSAMNETLRERIYQNANLKGRANVLIMPNMDAASITLGLLRSLTNARLVGPFLFGCDKPAHILIPSVSGRGILNMTALIGADITSKSDQ